MVRLNIIMEVSEVESNSKHIVLLIEHKKPGVLHRSDWARGLSKGTGDLRRKAVHIGDQSRKYMAAARWNMIMIYDSTAIVGLKMKWEEMEKWATDEILDVGLFFEERAETFLLTFLAVMEAGLAIHGI